MNKNEILGKLKSIFQNPECDPSWQELEDLMKRLIEEYFRVNFTSCKVEVSKSEHSMFDYQTVGMIANILTKIGITGIKQLKLSSDKFLGIEV